MVSEHELQRWQRMYLRAIERHHKNLDAILGTIAAGGEVAEEMAARIKHEEAPDER